MYKNSLVRFYTFEVNLLTLENTSSEEKNFSLFSYVEFCLWNAMDDMANFQRNLSIGDAVDGYDTSRDDFLGLGNSNAIPDAVRDRKCRNSVASGWYTAVVHQINISLKPGEKKSFVFLLGYCENPSDNKWEKSGVIRKDGAHDLIQKFHTEEQALEAFARLNQYWTELLSRYTVQSSNPHINRMTNIWNQYQCVVTFNMSRSASYYESGTVRGMGFRDSCWISEAVSTMILCG